MDDDALFGKAQVTAPIEYLDEDSLYSLFRSISQPRDLIIVRLLYELGCTIKELVAIRVRDIDFKERTVRIAKNNSRTNEDRIVTVSPTIITLVKEYLESQSLIDRRLAYLFQTSRKTPLTPRRIFQIVEHYLLASGVSAKPSPQLIKYTHIVHAYKQNIPMAEIEKHVGIQKQRLAQIFEHISLETEKDPYESFFKRMEKRENAE